MCILLTMHPATLKIKLYMMHQIIYGRKRMHNEIVLQSHFVNNAKTNQQAFYGISTCHMINTFQQQPEWTGPGIPDTCKRPQRSSRGGRGPYGSHQASSHHTEKHKAGYFILIDNDYHTILYILKFSEEKHKLNNIFCVGQVVLCLPYVSMF